MHLWTKAKSLARLGWVNVARVGLYRLGTKSGLHPACLKKFPPPMGEFYALPRRRLDLPTVQTWREEGLLFGFHKLQLEGDEPPGWLENPFTGNVLSDSQQPWWKIPDFDPEAGDIKGIWELSRFDWVLAFAQRAATGSERDLARLNDWLADWSQSNPPFQGPNWKCGQEASIRVMHLLFAARILEQVQTPREALIDLVDLHLQRISPTMSYAVAQDNNHGTSEAAALFMGGTWLESLGRVYAKKWTRKGRKWLENRVRRLIEPDGSFSQYSVNYHRVMLDTLCMAEIWRRDMGLQPFSSAFYERARAATNWLYHLVDPVTGDAPNIGANDGARLLPLSDSDYRDFRPSVQMAAVLFEQRRAYDPKGVWSQPLRWLGLDMPEESLPQRHSAAFAEGGYAVLNHDRILAVLRFPNFRFRPSQADALHLDVWMHGRNVLRDGGTFAYNTDDDWLDYFSGTASHNTIQFDDRNQMPSLGRFLFGEWLETAELTPLRQTPDGWTFRAGYRDYQGARHIRQVTLGQDGLTVEDVVDWFKEKAVLRWRLEPGDWKLNGTVLAANGLECVISSSVPIARIELVEGWESRYYLSKTPLPVLEVEIRQPGTLKSEFKLH